MDQNDILERLASIEHDQWIKWSQTIANQEKISPERIDRWKKLWIPYEELSEADKEHDRKWALKVIDEFIKQTTVFEKDLIKHPFIDSKAKEQGSATIHDLIWHLEFYKKNK